MERERVSLRMAGGMRSGEEQSPTSGAALLRPVSPSPAWPVKKRDRSSSKKKSFAPAALMVPTHKWVSDLLHRANASSPTLLRALRDDFNSRDSVETRYVGFRKKSRKGSRKRNKKGSQKRNRKGLSEKERCIRWLRLALQWLVREPEIEQLVGPVERNVRPAIRTLLRLAEIEEQKCEWLPSVDLKDAFLQGALADDEFMSTREAEPMGNSNQNTEESMNNQAGEVRIVKEIEYPIEFPELEIVDGRFGFWHEDEFCWLELD